MKFFNELPRMFSDNRKDGWLVVSVDLESNKIFIFADYGNKIDLKLSNIKGSFHGFTMKKDGLHINNLIDEKAFVNLQEELWNNYCD